MEQEKRKKIYNVPSDPTRQERIHADLTARIDTLTSSASTRVNWFDMQDVKSRTAQYLQSCADNSTVPTVMGLAAYGYGVTRQALYDFLKAHPDSETAQYIDVVRDALADYLCGAALKSDVNPVSAIFCLKNLHGFADRVEVAPVASSIVDRMNADDIRSRYLEE